MMNIDKWGYFCKITTTDYALNPPWCPLLPIASPVKVTESGLSVCVHYLKSPCAHIRLMSLA